MAGALFLAISKRVLTSFSPSPMNLDVSEEAVTLNKVVSPSSPANPRTSIVLPFPGGPNKRRPRPGHRRPRNKSGRCKILNRHYNYIHTQVQIRSKLSNMGVIYKYKRRYISRFRKLNCVSRKNPSNGTDFGILCFILPILSLSLGPYHKGVCMNE